MVTFAPRVRHSVLLEQKWDKSCLSRENYLLSNFRDICYKFLTEVCKSHYSAPKSAINIWRPLHLWSSHTSHTRAESLFFLFLLRTQSKLAAFGLFSAWIAIMHANVFLLFWNPEFHQILSPALRVCKANPFWRV